MKKFVAMMLVAIITFLTMPGMALAAYTETQLSSIYEDTADLTGWSMAVDGDAIVVGAPIDEYTETPATKGAVYLWEYSGGTWSNTAVIYDSGAPDNARFGTSVDISGDYIIVGAPYHTSNTGKVYIYDKSSGAGWETSPELTVSGDATGDQLGASVAINGSKAIAASPDGETDNDGTAFFFLETAGTWATDGTIGVPHTSGMSNLTNTVDIYGDFAVLGNQYAQEVYVYEYSGGWSQMTTVLKTGGSGRLGAGVSIYDTYIAVGDSWYNGNLGGIYIYEKDGAAWNDTKDVTLDNPNVDGGSGEFMGEHLDMNNGILVAGVQNDDANGSNSGSVYVFTGSGTTWVEDDNLTFAGIEANNQFGFGVGVDGDYVVAGAPFDASNAGTAFVFSSAAAGGGAVPEFRDYILILTIVVAIGFLFKYAPKIQPMKTR